MAPVSKIYMPIPLLLYTALHLRLYYCTTTTITTLICGQSVEQYDGIAVE
jgi:hypothetical protein